jgi:hypothetical protein
MFDSCSFIFGSCSFIPLLLCKLKNPKDGILNHCLFVNIGNVVWYMLVNVPKIIGELEGSHINGVLKV